MFQGSSEFTFNLFSTFVYLASVISPAAESVTVYCGKLSSHHANQMECCSDNMSYSSLEILARAGDVCIPQGQRCISG